MQENCYIFNATILFLFQELWDTTLACQGVTKNIKVDFQELLQTKTTRCQMEGLSVQDVFLGKTVPFIKNIWLLQPVVPSATRSMRPP